MFNSIQLHNFFSFREGGIICNPGVNLLIGINGSGKSNLLKAIRLVKAAAEGSDLRRLLIDQWGGFDNVYYYGSTTTSVRLTFEINNSVASNYGYYFSDPIVYELGIHKFPNTTNYYLTEKLVQPKPDQNPFLFLNFKNGEGFLSERKEENSKTHLVRYTDFDGQESVLGKIFDSDRYPALNAIRRMLSDITVYDYFDTTPNSRIRKPTPSVSDLKLLPDGSNLAQVLSIIKTQDKPTDRIIRETLHQINPAFRDYDFNFIGNGIELMLSEDGLNRSIHPTHISDGTLRFLCLLAILLNPKRGRLVCIDEPEVGLHPDMLLAISKAIQQAGEVQENSDQSQLVVSTHSEHILDRFSLEEIKVVEKSEQNASIINQYNTEQFAGWHENYQLPGQMWRAGDIGGNRY